MSKLRLGFFLIILLIALTACSQPARVVTVIVTQDQPSGQVQQTPQPPRVVTVIVTQDQPSEQVQPPPSPSQVGQTHEDCALAGAGTFVTCRIGRAYCSYRPDINGEPTFCNDAPFPTHSFTLLVWGQNWSDYDGGCLLVTGEVTRFEGKPQIVATSRSQVGTC